MNWNENKKIKPYSQAIKFRILTNAGFLIQGSRVQNHYAELKPTHHSHFHNSTYFILYFFFV